MLALVAAAAVLTACADDDDDTSSSATNHTEHVRHLIGRDDHGQPQDGPRGGPGRPRRRHAGHGRLPGRRATAEAAGYASSLDTFGCFTDPDRGGMGLHYIDESLLDDHVDITKPEALVYELDANGDITSLVAHEYIVPIDNWTEPRAAAAVRDRLPPAPDAPALGAPHLAVEGQPHRHLPRLEPSRPPVPSWSSRSSA